MTSEAGADRELIRVDTGDGVAVLTIDRPPVNALSQEAYRALARAVARVGADESVRVAILTGAGSRMFCAGADVKELATLDAAGRAAFFAVSNEARRACETMPIPVIAALNGPAVGAGVSYATFCDYRIAADHAYLAMAEIDRGSVAGGGATLMAVGVPSGALRFLLYTGRKVSAEEALAMHLVDEVVPAARLMTVARERAALIAAKPRHGLIQMKRAINLMSYNATWGDAGLEATQRMTAEMADRPETKAGMKAFLERKRPGA